MYLGIDFGTSGARACVMAPGGEIEEIARLEFGNLTPDEAAATWCEALFSLIAQIPTGLRRRLQALAIDGTSATVLACDEALNTTYPPLRYNDARAVAEAEAIRRAAGSEHPAAMATSGLAKVLWLKKHLGLRRARLYLNQADWLSALLSGRPVSDYHNALKMGLDLETGQWPAWVAFLADVDTLPVPVKPGTALALVERPRARELGINSDCLVRAGTTDSIAAFLAACQTLVVDSEKPPQRGQFFPDLPAHSRTMGQRSRCRFSDITNPAYPLQVQKAGEKWAAAAVSQPTIPKSDRLPATRVSQPGEAVTSLGTSLVLKLLSTTRVDACEYGIYSHWFGRYWLAGGASNAGGGVLRQYFSDDELLVLSAGIDTARASGLDYYPLPSKGERFPINDPEMLPRLEPRPPNRGEFLRGLLEGLANIEARGYRLLMELGATPLTAVASAGGGARNDAWTRIRARHLQVPVTRVLATHAGEQEACYGAARLACFGTELFPGGSDD